MDLMDVNRTARVLGIKPATLYRWAAQRKIPCVKVGDRLLFDADAIQQWLAIRVKSEQSLRERRQRERRTGRGGVRPHPLRTREGGR